MDLRAWFDNRFDFDLVHRAALESIFKPFRAVIVGSRAVQHALVKFNTRPGGTCIARENFFAVQHDLPILQDAVAVGGGSQFACGTVDIKIECVAELARALQQVPLDVHAVTSAKERSGNLDSRVGDQKPEGNLDDAPHGQMCGGSYSINHVDVLYSYVCMCAMCMQGWHRTHHLLLGTCWLTSRRALPNSRRHFASQSPRD